MPAPDRCIDLAAREMLASALAGALTDPFVRRTAAMPTVAESQLLGNVWHSLVQQHASLRLAELGLGELRPSDASISPLQDWLLLDRERRQRAYEAVFGLVMSRHCPQYETEYCHWTDPTYRAHQIADIAGFYSAFGLALSSARPDRHDHIAFEVEFIAFLHRKTRHAVETGGSAEQVETCDGALRAFVRDHVAWWMPTFARTLQLRAQKLADVCDDAELRADLGALVGVADVLRAWVAVARIDAGVDPARQIIAPRIQEQPQADACVTCTNDSP